MATEIILEKRGNIFIPVDQQAIDYISKKKEGAGLRCEIKEIRNYKFHKKYFSLLNYAFDNWEPGEVNGKYGKPQKNFERFREDIIILSGYYESVIRINGEVVIKAKSISFANMSQEEFEKLYSNTIDVILQRILRNYTKQDLEQVVQRVIGYC